MIDIQNGLKHDFVRKEIHGRYGDKYLTEQQIRKNKRYGSE